MKPCTDPLPPDAITAREAARLLGCSLNSVYRYILTGKVRGWKRGQRNAHLRLSRAEVLALFEPVTPREKPEPVHFSARALARRAQWTKEVLESHGLHL